MVGCARSVDSRVHPVATVALLVAYPLLSGATLGVLAFGLAAAVGAGHALVIAAVISGAVFLVDAAALCMAVTRREDDERTDERMFAFASVDAASIAPAHARAS